MDFLANIQHSINVKVIIRLGYLILYFALWSDIAGMPVPAREQDHPPGPEAGQHLPQRSDGDQAGGLRPRHQG